MVSNTLFTSNTEERYTPIDFFEEINKEFHFTLDPCATKENHKCEKFYTKEEDWLKQNRDNEIVFCNPPYWKEIKKRVEKWSLARGGVSLCFYLQEQIPNDSTTLFIEKQKSDLSKVVWNSDEQKILHRSQVCLQYLEIL